MLSDGRDTLGGANRDLVEGLLREAEVAAERACAFLKEMGWANTDSGIPLGFALNLAAGLRIHDWDLAGLSKYLDAALPLGRDIVLETLKAALATRQPKRQSGAGQPLFVTYLSTWVTEFAWAGRIELGVDVVIDRPAVLGEDELGAIADFLWVACHANIQ